MISYAVFCAFLFVDGIPITTNTLSLQISAELYGLLKAQAEKAHKTPEQVATDLISTCLSQQADPLEPWIGSIDSQSLDWVADHDKHLGAALQ